MSKRQIIYLVLAIIGGLSTWYFNIQYFIEHGLSLDVLAFVSAGMVNSASSSLAMDIGIAAITGFIWMVFESQRLQIKRVWIYILLGCFVAFAFAFPLFLCVREAYLEEEGVV